MKTSLNITPSPRLLQVLGDIPLANWQCLAELIDNSLDELLKEPNRSIGEPLRVDIRVEAGAHNETHVIVQDNGNGMTLDELERSLRAGHSAKNRYGSLGLFGMGFNIATARLGDVTRVETTTRGSDEMLVVIIDFAELQRNESFTVPLLRRPCDPNVCGTTVSIRLKKAVADDMVRAAVQQGIVKQLGDAYSYLLRDAVPGISREGFSAPIPAVITFNGEPVNAGLPCIWADNRTVTRAGTTVSAVQYIDVKLTEATACLHCGYWDRKNGPELCEECGSPHIQLRERRIWGWIGIQRYIDESHYGIDFLRYGRKILALNKSIFIYEDADTAASELEYPVEMPANKGRIVGEIHLDHVPVTYQKSDFNRQSRDWQTAVEAIRGKGRLKPRGAAAVNGSPLARLYSAFRRNDPGLHCLIPGDASTHIHSLARDWGVFFNKGVARYREDTEWYEAAQRHDRVKAGLAEVNTPGVEPGEGAPPANTVQKLLGKVGVTKAGPVPVPPKPLTEHEVLEKARILGTLRNDLSATFNLGRGLGSWKVTVITTKEKLEDGTGNGPTPARHGTIVGHDIEVFVCDEHPIFRQYGRDIRDAALMRVAEVIKGLAPSTLSVAAIYGELVEAVRDLKVTDAEIVDRIQRTLQRIRELMFTFVKVGPDSFWEQLTAEDKTAVEINAAVALPDIGLADLIDDGRFMNFVAADGLRRIIEAMPEALFDGKVFKPNIIGRNPVARGRVIGTVVRDIASLNDFAQDPLLRQKHDIAFALISLDHLETQLSSEDLHE